MCVKVAWVSGVEGGHKRFSSPIGAGSVGGGRKIYLVRLGVVKILMTERKIYPTPSPTDNKWLIPK